MSTENQVRDRGLIRRGVYRMDAIAKPTGRYSRRPQRSDHRARTTHCM